MILQRPSAEDIRGLYRAILDREPESDEVVGAKVNSGADLGEIIREMVNSTEAQRRNAGGTARFADPRYVAEIDVNAPDMARLRQHIASVWARLGQKDPYWSVLTQQRYRLEVFKGQDEAEFYATGASGIENFLDLCRHFAVSDILDGKVVDFGCGVGRLGEHLTQTFARYEGVDISQPHIDIAEARFEAIGRTNASFALLSDFLSRSDTFECFFTLIVLQHNPPPIMLELLNALMGRLTSGGIGYFQIPTYIEGYSFRLADYLAGLEGEGSMEMHALPIEYVLKAARSCGCNVLDIRLDNSIGPIGLSHTFLVQKAHEPARRQSVSNEAEVFRSGTQPLS